MRKKIRISVAGTSTQDLVAAGKLVKIEVYASTGDSFAKRVVEWLNQISKLSAGGASRSYGVLDGDGDDEKAIRLSIDGDGADRLLDARIVK